MPRLLNHSTLVKGFLVRHIGNFCSRGWSIDDVCLLSSSAMSDDEQSRVIEAPKGAF